MDVNLDVDRRDRLCVIGAGPSGITIAKNLREAGLAVDVIERQDDVGGQWYWQSAQQRLRVDPLDHLAARVSGYTDFPMPRSYPACRSHHQLHDYFHSYCDRFDLRPAIEFGRGVERVEPAAAGA